MAVNVKDAEEKLGQEKIEEIVEKEWEVADLPSEEELSQEVHDSPKARTNINSRKNLIQYRKDKPKEVKEKIVKALKYEEYEEDIDPKDILDNDNILELLEKLWPAKEILANRKEQEIYYNMINLFVKDFSVDELTSSDIHDIITLATNQVLEYRLLKVGAKNTLKVLEAAPTIEKFRKFSENVKRGLASRRVDRIDPKNRPSFSIVDLAAGLDQQEKEKFEQRIKELEESDQSYIPPKRED